MNNENKWKRRKNHVKKLCAVGVIFASLTGVSSAYADVIETDTTITNISFLPEVDVITPGIMSTTLGKSIKTHSSVKASNPLYGSAQATATSSASDLVDTIYAKVRVYTKSGGLEGSKEDSEQGSRYAGITYVSKSTTVPKEAYGNHKFIKAGYKSVINETHDFF